MLCRIQEYFELILIYLGVGSYNLRHVYRAKTFRKDAVLNIKFLQVEEQFFFSIKRYALFNATNLN